VASALSRADREKAKVEEAKRKESELLKGLRAELKKAQESQKEMKLLLDMYKSAPKEQRDKVQLMAAERKAKAEVDELRSRIRELEERDRRESKKIADEDALRRIRQAEEQIEHLQRKLGATKQVRPPCGPLASECWDSLNSLLSASSRWSGTTLFSPVFLWFPHDHLPCSISSLPVYHRKRRLCCQRWM